MMMMMMIPDEDDDGVRSWRCVERNEYVID